MARSTLRPARVIAPVAVLGLVLLGGCGGDLSDPAVTTASTTSPTTTPPATTPPATKPHATGTSTTLPGSPSRAPASTFPALDASFHGLGRLAVGIDPAVVESTLGVEFVAGGIQVERGSCAALVESQGRVGIVVDADRVQAYLIRVPGIPMTAFTEHPVEVGDPIDDVALAYPQWYAGEYSSYASRFDGPRITITPPELNGSSQAFGYAALFEADPSGTIRQIRVGSTAYVDHVDYCSTPD